MLNRLKREHWLKEHGFHNVDAICGAEEQPNRPTIQRCCALLLNETSGGLNIYGHEGSTPTLWGRLVTEENYKYTYLRRRTVEGQNGVGPTQLTSEGYQQEADRIGGCWNPLHNMQVGFRILHELIQQHGVFGGFEHYNGSGPAAREYAIRAIVHEQTLIHEGLR
jgi:hypothetical protein